MEKLPMEIIANLVASAIGVALGILASRIHRFLTFSRPVRRVWGILIKPTRRLLVAMTSLATTPEEGNRAVTTVAESTALADVLSLLRGEYAGLEIEIYPSDRFPMMKLGGRLLLTGGPINNKVTELVFNRYDLPFHFEGHDLFIDLNEGLQHSAVLVNGAVVKDYGLIAAMKNPFNEDSCICLVAGCYAYGVNAALRVMTWPFVKQLSTQIRSDEFLILVEADVVDEYVSMPQIVSICRLTKDDSVGTTSSHRRLVISQT